MESVEVSVIVPIYNAQEYLRRCVDSVLMQTYQNFELILINDGSTDDSAAICEEYALKDSRVKMIHKNNTGVSASRNVGLKNATGKYVLFVDSDDYIESDMLENLIHKACETKSDITMCGYYIQQGNKIIPAKMDYRYIYNTKQDILDGLIYRFYIGDNVGLNSLWNKLIRKDLYWNNNIRFNCSLKRAEDMWFVFECLKNAERVAFLSEPYYHYVQNTESVMHKVYLDQYQQWKYTRTRLLVENRQFGFRINMPAFYKSFLQNTILYVKTLLKNNQEKLAVSILEDELLHEAVRYITPTSFSVHVYIILALEKERKYKIIILLLKVWNYLDDK